MEQRLSGIGRNLQTVGLVTGKAATSAIKSAMEFETAFTGVRKTVEAPIDSDVEEYFADLHETILDSSTYLPVSAANIASVYSIAGQLRY